MGGKWTTYRKMAEDCVDHAILLARLEERPCVTSKLSIHGARSGADLSNPLAVYGSDAEHVQGLMQQGARMADPLHAALPVCGAQVVWAVRSEMARTVEDVLARRTRALFLNARAAIAMAPTVARLMAHELRKDESWEHDQIASFNEVALCFVAEQVQ